MGLEANVPLALSLNFPTSTKFGVLEVHRYPGQMNKSNFHRKLSRNGIRSFFGSGKLPTTN